MRGSGFVREDHLRDAFIEYLESKPAAPAPLRQFVGGFPVRGIHFRKPHSIPDILLFGSRGQLGIVEVKLSSNRECGAPLVHQLLGYYVQAIARDWNEMDTMIRRSLQDRRNKDFARRITADFLKEPNRRHDRRKYRLYAVVDEPAWHGGQRRELKEAGRWARAFLERNKLMPTGVRAWFVVHQRHGFKPFAF